MKIQLDTTVEFMLEGDEQFMIVTMSGKKMLAEQVNVRIADGVDGGDDYIDDYIDVTVKGWTRNKDGSVPKNRRWAQASYQEVMKIKQEWIDRAKKYLTERMN